MRSPKDSAAADLADVVEAFVAANAHLLGQVVGRTTSTKRGSRRRYCRAMNYAGAKKKACFANRLSLTKSSIATKSI